MFQRASFVFGHCIWVIAPIDASCLGRPSSQGTGRVGIPVTVCLLCAQYTPPQLMLHLVLSLVDSAEWLCTFLEQNFLPCGMDDVDANTTSCVGQGVAVKAAAITSLACALTPAASDGVPVWADPVLPKGMLPFMQVGGELGGAF